MLPTVYPIVDSALLQRRDIDTVQFAATLLEGGASLLQFRHKEPFTRDAFRTAEQISEMCAAAHARLIINDRADVARLLGAGAHVGQEDLAPQDARKVLGTEAWLGYSTHNEAQLREGNSLPVDYLAIGPVFPTSSKERPDPVLGLTELARISGIAARPLVAIGGITLDTAPAVLRSGVSCIAVVSALVPDSGSLPAARRRMEEWLKATKQ